MNFTFSGTRVDATGFASLEQATLELEALTRIPLRSGKIAVIVKPWEIYTSTFNPHGYGVPKTHIYAVANYAVVAETEQFDTGEILLAYRRVLRENIKSATFESDAACWHAEIKRIEVILFGLGLGFVK